MPTLTQPKEVKQTQKIMVCPGAKACGITTCQHHHPHVKTEGCDNGCFGNTGCVVMKDNQ